MRLTRRECLRNLLETIQKRKESRMPARKNRSKECSCESRKEWAQVSKHVRGEKISRKGWDCPSVQRWKGSEKGRGEAKRNVEKRRSKRGKVPSGMKN